MLRDSTRFCRVLVDVRYLVVLVRHSGRYIFLLHDGGERLSTNIPGFIILRDRASLWHDEACNTVKMKLILCWLEGKAQLFITGLLGAVTFAYN